MPEARAHRGGPWHRGKGQRTTNRLTLATSELPRRPGHLEDPGDPPTGQSGNQMLKKTLRSPSHLKRLGCNMFLKYHLAVYTSPTVAPRHRPEYHP